MIYIFIDESGDTGELHESGATADFAMAACICYTENIEYMSDKIRRLGLRIKKKEIKFSKLSIKDIQIIKKFLNELGVEYFSSYSRKNPYCHGEVLLKNVLKDLIQDMSIADNEKIKVFIDGTENAYFRKIYEPIIRKKFPRATVKFANSMKTPMIQVADFYAGYRRRREKSSRVDKLK